MISAYILVTSESFIPLTIKNTSLIATKRSQCQSAHPCKDVVYSEKTCFCLMLQANSNISADDHQDLTPLHHACMSGSLQTVQLLLKNKAGVNPKDKVRGRKRFEGIKSITQCKAMVI